MKISIIGAGRVGSTTAYTLMERGLGHQLALVDIAGDLARGEAMDLFHATSAVETPMEVAGSDDYSITEGSDLAIITAGLARKPGQSRLDLAETNAGIIKGIVKQLEEHNDHCMLFVVANPVDVLTNVALQSSDLSRERVFGLGTLLDTIRLRSHLARALGGGAEGINAMIIGEHGDSMLPVFRDYEEQGVELSALDSVFQEVRDAAIRVIELKGATFYAPAVAIAEAVDAIVRDTGSILPMTTYLEEHDFCIGHPARVDADGVKAVDFPLTDGEEELFRESLGKLKGVLAKVL